MKYFNPTIYFIIFSIIYKLLIQTQNYHTNSSCISKPVFSNYYNVKPCLEEVNYLRSTRSTSFIDVFYSLLMFASLLVFGGLKEGKPPITDVDQNCVCRHTSNLAEKTQRCHQVFSHKWNSTSCNCAK